MSSTPSLGIAGEANEARRTSRTTQGLSRRGRRWLPLHDEVVHDSPELPLWFDLGGLRVIHACWDQWSMSVLSPHLANNNSMSEDGLEGGGVQGNCEFDTQWRSCSRVLKCRYRASLGISTRSSTRSTRRYRWWRNGPTTYWHRAHLPSDALGLDEQPHRGFPDIDLSSATSPAYVGPPVVYGHYWQTGLLQLTSPITVCVDYSAGKGGPLAAYRWSGETTLTDLHLVAAE